MNNTQNQNSINPRTGQNTPGVTYGAPTASAPYGTYTIPSSSATTNVNQSNQPINAAQLGNSAPQIPAPVNTNTAQMNLGAQTTAFTEGAVGNQQLAQQQTQAQQVITPTNSRQGILDKISSLLGVQSTQGDVTQDIYDQEGVFVKKQLVTKLEGEALAKDRAYTKMAEKIRQNAEGKLESGVQIDLANLERQRNSELADIAIQSKVAMGAYADATAIAEAKIKAQFEPIENQIKSLQNLYQLYADDMTESEKMQAQAKIQEQQSAADFARQKELINYKAQIDLAQRITEGKAKGLSGTAEQFKAAGYANRIEQANGVISQLGETLKGMSKVGFATQLAAPSYLQSPQMQQFSQAARNYVNAVLRRESGAAIAPEEFKNALKQYIPSPGDSDAVLKQKEQNRLLIQRNYINEASTAYEPLSTDLMPQVSAQVGSNPVSSWLDSFVKSDTEQGGGKANDFISTLNKNWE